MFFRFSNIDVSNADRNSQILFPVLAEQKFAIMITLYTIGCPGQKGHVLKFYNYVKRKIDKNFLDICIENVCKIHTILQNHKKMPKFKTQLILGLRNAHMIIAMEEIEPIK